MKKILLLTAFLNFAAISATFSQTLNIGLCLDDTIAKRWLTEKALLEETITNKGHKYITTICEGNPKDQAKQAYELIDKHKVDVLLIVANDGEIMAEVVNYAHSKNIITIAYDRMIPHADLDIYISFDNVMVGKMMAESMIELTPKGNYMIISGPVKDNNSLLLEQGKLEALKPHMESGNIHLVYSQHTKEWLDAAAFQCVFDFTLSNPDVAIDVILAANDNMAGGALEALEISGLENVKIAGQDAEIDALKRIKEGKQSVTVHKPVEQLAVISALIASGVEEKIIIEKFKPTVSTINNGKKEVKAFLLLPDVIDSSNVDTLLH